ncbi:hypothetical protein HIM_07155 [Hirsutella minnesotensis 3608]|uniref:Uncharacterized protein n=1 Tax=Hirsutella minnesotensis 3608 TaxID=1043627 RepID=A0A0F7ZI24_9HYPO|nr:hypothetical protein HIM_07155 [Hirsutella minnesotensis 3608]
MTDVASQLKSTPARRRPGRGDGRPSAQKAYASENDAAALETGRHRKAPQTPSKAMPASPALGDSGSTKEGSKSRNRNKIRDKNAQTSPDSSQHGRQTPPQRCVSMKPSTAAAFAGATFHASPAPSALPLPSFHAKPSGDTPLHAGAKGTADEPSPPATDVDAPTPLRPSSVPRTHESPLDFMFRAHREEKERHHCRPHANGGIVSNPCSPQPPAQPNFTNSPSLSSLSQSRRPISRQLSSGPDHSDLEWSPRMPMGPAFSTPYQERIRVARSSATHAQNDQSRIGTSHAPVSEEDPAEALKKFLFGGNPNLHRHADHNCPPPKLAMPKLIDPMICRPWRRIYGEFSSWT